MLLEKPIAEDIGQALRLQEHAARRGVTLMVDHPWVYAGAVESIKHLSAAGALGEPYYYDGIRVNLGQVRPDVNVLWDLAIHDLTILDFLLGKMPEAVSATGVPCIRGYGESIAYMTLYFERDFIAHVHVNWLAPVKIRKIMLGGSDRMLVYDESEPVEKVRVYDKGIDLADSADEAPGVALRYRNGDAWIAPTLDPTEALCKTVVHFLACIRSSQEPITDAAAGICVLRVLEAADQFLSRRGAPVALGPE